MIVAACVNGAGYNTVVVL